jgi:hypothetical protein
VQYTGNDSTGTHRATTNLFDVTLASTHIQVGGIVVEESLEARQAFEKYFRGVIARPNKIMMCLRRVLSPRQVIALRRLIHRIRR